MGIPPDWAHRKGFKILGVTYGLASNVEGLIHNPAYFEPGEIYSQITNWEVIEKIELLPQMDSSCLIHDDPGLPFQIRSDGKELFVQGNISQLEKESTDRRWTLLGNIGLWYRHALAIQEQHGIYSLHAAAIYKPDENELVVIIGKAGAGKTVFVLESISRGYQIFSTEMTYFRLSQEGVHFYRGALHDNIRVGSFVYDFPEAVEILNLELPQVENPWDHKISVAMHCVTTTQSELINPTISFIFPRIERGVSQPVVRELSNPRVLVKYLYDSASEKIGSTILMYERIPSISLDSEDLALARWQAMSELAGGTKWKVKQAKSTFAGPKSCMEKIDE
jgi:hypothetical protein